MANITKYVSKDGQEITLSFESIKQYLVQGKKELITNQELVFFIAICKSRGLNPFKRDAYLVKYDNSPAAIITSIDYFRSRARAQKDCQGWKKGIIVMNKDGLVRDSFGLILPDDTLIGGWFEARPTGWVESWRLEVNLSGYIKKTKEGKTTKFWAEEKQPTMIAKVAEAQGLRTLWPDEFQQLYTEEEIDRTDEPIDITPEQRGDNISKALDEGVTTSGPVKEKDIPIVEGTGIHTPGEAHRGLMKELTETVITKETQQEAGPKKLPTAGQTLKDDIKEIEEKEYLDDINPEIRKLYISKRKGKGRSGLSGVVMEHAKEIPYWPKGNFDELVSKWALMYKGNPPFPKSIKWLGTEQPEEKFETTEEAQEEKETDRVKDEPEPIEADDPKVAAEIPELCNRCDKEGCGGAFSQLYSNVDGAITCELFVFNAKPDKPDEYIDCEMYGQRKNVTVCAKCKKGLDGKCPQYEEYLMHGAIQFGKGRERD
ncbi:MAG: phage recombination protein Bet [Desulfobacteraceae bacterium]|nr:MAG: phage recombination protein Bet [Desulfobacteraceae bacterium]